MSIDPIFWLLAAVGFLALEGMTFSMVSVWFAAGSAAALLCCLFTHSFRVQALRSARSACGHSSRWPNGCTSSPPPPTVTAPLAGRPGC